MAECPYCHKEVSKPQKSLENRFFLIEAYTCDECKGKFKIAKEFPIYWTENLQVQAHTGKAEVNVTFEIKKLWIMKLRQSAPRLASTKALKS